MSNHCGSNFVFTLSRTDKDNNMSQSSNANRIQKGILAIDQQLYDFIENEVLPKVGVDSDSYWSGFEKVIKEFKKQVKKKFIIKIQGRRPGDIEMLITSNSRLKKFIKWSPKYSSLRKIVNSCINWERQLKKH